MKRIYLLLLLLFSFSYISTVPDLFEKVFHVVIKNSNDIKSLIPMIKKEGFNTLVLGLYNGVKLDSMFNHEKIRTWDKK